MLRQKTVMILLQTARMGMNAQFLGIVGHHAKRNDT